MILICNITPFTYSQQISILDDSGNLEKIRDIYLVDLYKFVPNYCHQNNISKVQLFGNKEYNEMVSNQIKHNEELFFSEYSPIEVEVMG